MFVVAHPPSPSHFVMVQMSPSSQGEPKVRLFRHPSPGTQMSFVHAFPSSQLLVTP